METLLSSIKNDELLLEDIKYLHVQQVYSLILNCKELLAQKAKIKT